MNELEKQEEQVALSLKKAIQDALENKRRLGQYAIVAEDGKPKRIGPGSGESSGDTDSKDLS